VVEDPMGVMFERSKEYQIRAKAELTPGLWVEKPYVTYGELEMVEKMVQTHRSTDLLERSMFKANEF
jgi:hypothetical protein